MVQTALRTVVPVTGPPTAGKSSALMELTRRAPQLARFGVRDYGLHLAAQGVPLGLTMREALVRGELLPDALVRAEFVHFLDHLPSTVEVIAVEGYPRDLAQCADLVSAARERDCLVAAYVVIDVPDYVVRARAVGRRICARCGMPDDIRSAEHVTRCGGVFIRRRDDESAALERRLTDYRAVSSRLREYFSVRGLLRELDGTRPREQVSDVLADLLNLTGSRHGERSRP